MKNMHLLLRACTLVATLAGGCGRLVVHHEWVVDPPPNADTAKKAIFQAYKMKSMPIVYWYGPQFLNCGDGYGYKDQTGTCVRGDQEDGVIVQALWPGFTFSGTAPTGDKWPWVADLPHEFAHEASDQRGEDGCADHNCHWFKRGGEGEQATGALALLGM